MIKNYLIAIAALVLLLSAVSGYDNYGHTLGIKSAKFQRGDCIVDGQHAEFKNVTKKRMVKQVGKSEYLLAHMESDYVVENWMTGESISDADQSYQKTECFMKMSKPEKVSSK